MLKFFIITNKTRLSSIKRHSFSKEKIEAFAYKWYQWDVLFRNYLYFWKLTFQYDNSMKKILFENADWYNSLLLFYFYVNLDTFKQFFLQNLLKIVMNLE